MAQGVGYSMLRFQIHIENFLCLGSV